MVQDIFQKLDIYLDIFKYIFRIIQIYILKFIKIEEYLSNIFHFVINASLNIYRYNNYNDYIVNASICFFSFYSKYQKNLCKIDMLCMFK